MKASITNLHPSQEEVYYHQSLDTTSPHYNIGGYLQLKSVNEEVFVDAIYTLVEVFDIFSLTFDFASNRPQGCFQNEPNQVHCQRLDFSQRNTPEKKALQWMQDRYNTVFPLEQNELYEIALLKISDQKYFWFVRFHHLITDGYSIAHITQYVVKKYVALMEQTGEVFTYPSYQEAIEESIHYLKSDEYQQDADYWLQKCQQPNVPLLKQNNYRSSKVKSSRFLLPISIEQKKSLEELALKNKVSIPLITLGALTVYFGNVLDHKEFFFGASVHNRRNRRQRKTVGMFSKNMPFKTYYDKEQTVDELLSTIRAEQRRDYRHISYPLSHLNRALGVVDKNSPLFDIVVNYQNQDIKSEVDGYFAASTYLTSNHEPFPMNISWCDYGKGNALELLFTYQTTYLLPEEVSLFAKRLLYILETFTQDTHLKVSDINILPDEERNLLAQFNAHKLDYPDHQTVSQVFEEQCLASPSATALVDKQASLTYDELDQYANQIAHYLRANGVAEGDTVALCINRCAAMVGAILGILKAGAVYVPVDPSNPKDRIHYMLKDSGAKILVSNLVTKTKIVCPEAVKLLLLDAEGESVYAFPTNEVERKSESQYAYIMYTSGTTGQPKGVLVQHYNILKITYETNHIAICPEDRVLQWSNFSFDGSVYELFGALLNGASLWMIEEKDASDTKRLAKVITENRVTVSFMTTALFNVFVEVELNALKGLRKLMFGGELISPVHVQKALVSLGEHKLVHVYGPTETTVFATAYSIDTTEDGVIPIGAPLSNTEIYITNKAQSLLPVGCVGEIYIGGDGVSAGYLHPDKGSDQKFITHPFVEGGGRVYRTGDMGRWLPNGTVEFIGRLDEQIKIRGYRVELGEIEMVIQQSDIVSQNVVMAKQDGSGTLFLIAYIVARSTYSRDAFAAYLSSKLPGYMVPKVVTVLDEMPLTTNGKVDKKKLPEPDFQQLARSAYVAPTNTLQHQLADLWQELLGIQQVGIHDNFFELGGHSLLATRLVAAVHKALAKRISIKDIFLSPTIAGLTTIITNAEENSVPPVTVVTPRPDQLPLSFSQERLWFVDQLEGSSSYHMPALFRMKGELNKEAIYSAFSEIVNRHEVLRTVFLEKKDGQVYQKVTAKDRWTPTDVPAVTTEST